jgi:osmotically inducible protein OsmC
MALKQNKAEITWEGGLQDGRGQMSVASGAFPPQTVTFSARTESAPGTNPEELIAAAHATCFAMALSHRLGQNGTPPQRLHVTATCSLDRAEDGLKITTMDLLVEGEVPGLAPDEFERLAAEAEQRCPVSNALRDNVDIRLTARPVTSAAR